MLRAITEAGETFLKVPVVAQVMTRNDHVRMASFLSNSHAHPPPGFYLFLTKLNKLESFGIVWSHFCSLGGLTSLL